MKLSHQQQAFYKNFYHDRVLVMMMKLIGLFPVISRVRFLINNLGEYFIRCLSMYCAWYYILMLKYLHVPTVLCV